jgi:hypothetical protein
MKRTISGGIMSAFANAPPKGSKPKPKQEETETGNYILSSLTSSTTCQEKITVSETGAQDLSKETARD